MPAPGLVGGTVNVTRVAVPHPTPMSGPEAVVLAAPSPMRPVAAQASMLTSLPMTILWKAGRSPSKTVRRSAQQPVSPSTSKSRCQRSRPVLTLTRSTSPHRQRGIWAAQSMSMPVAGLLRTPTLGSETAGRLVISPMLPAAVRPSVPPSTRRDKA